MSMKVTSGRVSFSRKVQPADFESKGATVELAFEVEDGDDVEDVLLELGPVARRHVLRLISGKKRAD